MSDPVPPTNAGRVLILGTGGTIAGTGAAGQPDNRYKAGELAIRELVEPLFHDAGLDGTGTASHRWSVRDVARIDSRNMSHAVWADLIDAIAQGLEDPDVAGIIVTHGTDTLEETAVLLGRVFEPRKPVVLTAAMRPATSPLSDGPTHLVQAVQLALQGGRPGLYLAFAGKVWAGPHVRKIHPFALEAFNGGDASPQALWVGGRWVWQASSAATTEAAACAAAGAAHRRATLLTLGPERWPSVVIVHSHAGADGRSVEALLADDRVKGVVVAATGNGSVHDAIQDALCKAVGAGRIGRADVLVATRCLTGWIEGDPEHGWPTAHRLTPAQARVWLMVEMAMRECGRAQ